MGSKMSRSPRKIPRNAPLYVLPHTRKITSRTFKIRGTLVFLCPKERERESERERKSKRERVSESKSESESERARERARAEKGKGER